MGWEGAMGGVVAIAEKSAVAARNRALHHAMAAWMGRLEGVRHPCTSHDACNPSGLSCHSVCGSSTSRTGKILPVRFAYDYLGAICGLPLLWKCRKRQPAMRSSFSLASRV